MIIRCKFCRILKDRDKTVKFRFACVDQVIISCDKCFQLWEDLDKNNSFALTKEQKVEIENEIIKQIAEVRKIA